ncbi:MAG: transcriptional repressor [Spirochaetota bacterium]
MKESSERLKQKKLKLTPQRLAILDYLEGNTSHPSAQGVYGVLKKKYPSLSLATVYNTLETLKEIGDLQELSIDAERKRFDPNPNLHHHFLCTRCGRVLDIFRDFNLAPPLEKVKVRNYQINFYGLCDQCSLKNPK